MDEDEAMRLGYDRTKYGFTRQDLEAMGERAVRDALNTGKYGHPGLAPFAFVSAWLADQEFARSEAESAKRDDREKETLSIAKDANRIAIASSRWAMWAAIIAIIAVVAEFVRWWAT